MSTNLPARQKDLYDLLFGKGDVDILDIYAAMSGPEEHRDDLRYAQQWLGSTITRLNRSLEGQGLRVVPGRLKGTYALIVVK